MQTPEEIIEEIIPNRPWQIGGNTDIVIADLMQKYAEQFKPKWNYVNQDKLPPVGVEVIVYLDNFGQYDLAIYKTTGTWRSTNSGDPLEFVSRWMLIPV